MPQPCKICNHADRQVIDAALLEGYPPLRVIGEQYGVSKDSLSRHYHAHLRDDGAGDDDQADEDRGGLSLAVTEKEPEAEARRVAEISEQKKEPEPNESPWAVDPERVRQLIEQIRARLRESNGSA